MRDLPLARFVRIDDEKGPRGSGFRLDARRVLTAGHVVAKAVGELRVRDPKGLRFGSVQAKVAWAPAQPADGAALDAVLLETEPVEGVEPWRSFLEAPLSAERAWKSRASPAGVEKPGEQRSLNGRAHEYPEGSPIAELVLTEGEPTSVEVWGGISGAPVLAEDPGVGGWTLLGVIRAGPEDFEGRRLTQVPLPTLIAAGLLAELELPGVEARCAPYVERAAALLDQELAERLAAFNTRWSAAWKAAAKPGELARILCLETLPAELAATLADAHEALADAGDAERAERVFDLVRWVLPAAYLCHGDPELPPREATEASVDLISEVLAEIAAAAIDGGPVELAAPADPDDLPATPFRVSTGIEAGVDPHGRQKLEDLASQLGIKLAMGSVEDVDRRVLRLILDRGTKRLAPGELGWLPPALLRRLDRLHENDPELWLEALLVYVNQRLADPRLYKRRYFYVDEGREARAFVERLRERVPELRRMVLAAPRIHSTDEISIETSLQRIYHRRARAAEERR